MFTIKTTTDPALYKIIDLLTSNLTAELSSFYLITGLLVTSIILYFCKKRQTTWNKSQKLCFLFNLLVSCALLLSINIHIEHDLQEKNTHVMEKTPFVVYLDLKKNMAIEKGTSLAIKQLLQLDDNMTQSAKEIGENFSSLRIIRFAVTKARIKDHALALKLKEFLESFDISIENPNIWPEVGTLIKNNPEKYEQDIQAQYLKLDQQLNAEIDAHIDHIGYKTNQQINGTKKGLLYAITHPNHYETDDEYKDAVYTIFKQSFISKLIIKEINKANPYFQDIFPTSSPKKILIDTGIGLAKILSIAFVILKIASLTTLGISFLLMPAFILWDDKAKTLNKYALLISLSITFFLMGFTDKFFFWGSYVLTQELTITPNSIEKTIEDQAIIITALTIVISSLYLILISLMNKLASLLLRPLAFTKKLLLKALSRFWQFLSKFFSKDKNT